MTRHEATGPFEFVGRLAKLPASQQEHAEAVVRASMVDIGREGIAKQRFRSSRIFSHELDGFTCQVLGPLGVPSDRWPLDVRARRRSLAARRQAD